MTPAPVTRLPAALESALQRVKLAVRSAVERSIESLGLAALASGQVHQRDNLLAAQYELNRKSALFVLAFEETFDERSQRAWAPRPAYAGGPSGWDALSLVDEHDVELQVAADRAGAEIANACEWELRELEGYIGSLLGAASADAERNPLRPALVGYALLRGVERLSDRAELRKVLAAEIGRSLVSVLRKTYQDIIADLRNAGVQPMGLSVRMTEARSSDRERPSSAFDALERSGDSERHSGGSMAGGFDHQRSRSGGGGERRQHGGAGRPLGQIDPAMMALIRRLAFTEVGPATGAGAAGWDDEGEAPGAGRMMAPNLIHAYRDELRQASAGALDHMVIDVIGTLFDAILSDPKVPPQMARQIARLQLPVLRAALGDPGFFSSRRHPVRRFVNRIASLGAAFEDFADEGAQRFLAKVRDLVQQVVEGDFDQIGLYEQHLDALERFTAEQARSEVDARGDAAELLAAKEDERQLRALYAHQLQGELKGLAAPEFVRDFVAGIWSQVLIRAAESDGADSARVQRLRRAGRELFMSVQPKPSPALRKTFLAELPKLMHDLNEGMELIQWPPASRRAFFGQLLPAHAESLKGQGLRPLDYNLLAKEVDNALDKPLPSRADLKAAGLQLPVLDDVLAEAAAAPQFSAAEAARIGLLEESAVDWDGKVDIDLSAEPELAAAEIQIAGLPKSADPPEAPEPMQGGSLADHVQIGFAYQMHLEDGWQKVRLNHVSAGRSFFVFTRGHKHQQTISLTHRMLVRMCESGRLRAFENAYLLERATARARRQLASLGAAA